MATLNLDIPEDNSLVPVTPRTTNDLPLHIKGHAAWHRGHNQTNPPTYWVEIDH